VYSFFMQLQKNIIEIV